MHQCTSAHTSLGQWGRPSSNTLHPDTLCRKTTGLGILCISLKTPRGHHAAHPSYPEIDQRILQQKGRTRGNFAPGIVALVCVNQEICRQGQAILDCPGFNSHDSTSYWRVCFSNRWNFQGRGGPVIFGRPRIHPTFQPLKPFNGGQTLELDCYKLCSTAWKIEHRAQSSVTTMTSHYSSRLFSRLTWLHLQILGSRQRLIHRTRMDWRRWRSHKL